MNIQAIKDLLNQKRITKKQLQQALNNAGFGSAYTLTEINGDKGFYNPEYEHSFQGGYNGWRGIAMRIVYLAG